MMAKPTNIRNKKTKSAQRKNLASSEPKPAPKKNVIDHILAGARVDEDPRARASYEAILGLAGPSPDLALSNQALLAKILSTARRALQRHLVDNAFDWGVQVTRCGVVAGTNVEVDVPSIRKTASYYSRAGVDAISMIVPGPMPLASHPCGFGVALDARAIVFGPNVRAAMQKAELKARQRSKDLPLRSPIKWHTADDEIALKEALTNMFRPPLTKVPHLEGPDEATLVEGWDTHESRQCRGLFTLMTRSMLPLKKALMLVGEGRSVMVGAITAAEVSIKKARREGELPVHPDGLPHFYFGELRRLDRADFAVPLIKLR